MICTILVEESASVPLRRDGMAAVQWDNTATSSSIAASGNDLALVCGGDFVAEGA